MSGENSDLPVVLAKIDSRFDLMEARLERIERQTTLTNGRVTSLELTRAAVEGFAGAFSWGPPALAAIVAGLVVYLLTN